MASLSLYGQFETKLISNRKVIELVLQLKDAKAHCKNYIKVKPHLARHLLGNRLLRYSKKYTSLEDISNSLSVCSNSFKASSHFSLHSVRVSSYLTSHSCIFDL